MDDKTFFKYYIPALKKALSEDHIDYGFFVNPPSSFYPEEIWKELEIYEDKLSTVHPFVEQVAYYFDAKSHNFPTYEGMDINDFKHSIVNEMLQLEKKYLTFD